MYRGVYPVPFDVLSDPGRSGFGAIWETLLAHGLAAPGDRILLTAGHEAGVAGGTNTMKILTVEPG
jgi:pyruvate kinase